MVFWPAILHEGNWQTFSASACWSCSCPADCCLKGHLLCALQWPNPFLDSVWSLSFLTALICGFPSCKTWPTSFLVLSSSFLWSLHLKMHFFLLPPSWWIPAASLVLREWGGIWERVPTLKSDKLMVETWRCHVVPLWPREEFYSHLPFLHQ